MKIQILVSIKDSEYREHLTRILMEKYAGEFDVGICSDPEKLKGMAEKHRYDVAICDTSAADFMNMLPVHLCVLLCDDTELRECQISGVKKVQKYQRISGIVSETLEKLAEASEGSAFGANRGSLTVCFSAAGGSGKTTVALAYAARRVAEGKKVVYLDLEAFASTSVYFREPGKSISSVFGKLDSNVELLLKSIRMQDPETGIYYFGNPENYDDVNVLTAEDVTALTEGGVNGVDELVVDLPSGYDAKIKKLLEMADTVLLVVGKGITAQVKHEQFKTQNNIYKEILKKTVLVANNGARAEDARAAKNICLPTVQSEDPIVVFKSLSGMGL